MNQMARDMWSEKAADAKRRQRDPSSGKAALKRANRDAQEASMAMRWFDDQDAGRPDWSCSCSD